MFVFLKTLLQNQVAMFWFPFFLCCIAVGGALVHGGGVAAEMWWRAQIDYMQPPASRDSHAKDAFIGSPSIVSTSSKATTGTMWLASHDRFFSEEVGTTYVFASNDLVAWRPTAAVSPMYWAQLFSVKQPPASVSPNIYLIGPSSDLTGEGDLVISRCTDVPCSGTNWTTPSVLVKGDPQSYIYMISFQVF